MLLVDLSDLQRVDLVVAVRREPRQSSIAMPAWMCRVISSGLWPVLVLPGRSQAGKTGHTQHHPENQGTRGSGWEEDTLPNTCTYAMC